MHALSSTCTLSLLGMHFYHSSSFSHPYTQFFKTYIWKTSKAQNVLWMFSKEIIPLTLKSQNVWLHSAEKCYHLDRKEDIKRFDFLKPFCTPVFIKIPNNQENHLIL